MRDVMQKNAGTLSGTPTLIPTLLERDPGQALSFDVGDSFTIADSPSISLPVVVGGAAFEFSFRLPALPGAEGQIFGKAGSYAVKVTPAGKLKFHLENGASSVDLLSAITLVPGVKYHAICVYNGGYTGTPQVGVTTQGSLRFSIPADQRQGAYTDAQNIQVSKFTMLEKGRIDQVNLGFIRTPDATSPEWLAAVLYADDAGAPGALLDQAAPQQIWPSETFVFQPYPVSGAILDEGESFWQGVIAGSGFAEFGPISFAYETTGGVGRKSGSHRVSDSGSTNFTGSAPDPFGAVGATDADDKLSMYCDYTPLARTGDEGQVVIYIDGQEDTRTAYTAGIADSANDVTGPTIAVDLDALSFWNKKLSAVQAAKHFAAR